MCIYIYAHSITHQNCHSSVIMMINLMIGQCPFFRRNQVRRPIFYIYVCMYMHICRWLMIRSFSRSAHVSPPVGIGKVTHMRCHTPQWYSQNTIVVAALSEGPWGDAAIKPSLSGSPIWWTDMNVKLLSLVTVTICLFLFKKSLLPPRRYQAFFCKAIASAKPRWFVGKSSQFDDSSIKTSTYIIYIYIYRVCPIDIYIYIFIYRVFPVDCDISCHGY